MTIVDMLSRDLRLANQRLSRQRQTLQETSESRNYAAANNMPSLLAAASAKFKRQSEQVAQTERVVKELQEKLANIKDDEQKDFVREQEQEKQGRQRPAR